MKRIVRYVVGALLSMGLIGHVIASGAGEQGAPGKTPAATSAKAPVKLSLLIDNQSPTEGLRAVAAAAEKKFNIKIVFNLRPGGSEGDNVVKTRLAAGDMDDLCVYNSGSLYMALNPAKHFVDLTDEPYMANILDSFKQTVSVNGRVYGAPSGELTAGGWFYNKKVYAELGLKVPRTWAELMANCEKIKAAGKIPVVASYKDDWTSQLILLADYYNVQAKYLKFADDYTAGKAKFATTPIALRGFEKLQEVYIKGYINKDPLATTYEQALKMLLDGQGGHYPMLAFALPNMQAIDPEKVKDIGFFGQPGDDVSNNGLTVWIPGNISIYKGSKNIDAAKQFIRFCLSVEGFAIYMAAQKPTGPFAVKGITLPDDILPAVKDVLVYVNNNKTAPALEFLSPIKGPNLPQICVQTGIGIKSPLESAKEYDRDVEKQAKQLGLPGW
ncbi:MAG TPA: extracellular solute-binding protein [Termitinemataceae bacterium]|nr:extracellular solute-binding protein [Termitinemataceae bacterium]HPQ01148.1 extracellular solute-binding protein [Termitinemataceae bacterium]